MSKNVVSLYMISFLMFSCSKNNNIQNEQAVSCNFKTVISYSQYLNAPSDLVTINDLEIIDNCLKINFSSSGCDGNSWELILIDSEDVLGSNPPQRNLRLSLKSNELCNAYISKELMFNISNLQVDGSKVLLNITNLNESILYAY